MAGERKGTVTPATPGFSQGSARIATPWTPIATRAASAVCSCSAFIVRAKPGWRTGLPAMVRPRNTEIVTRTKATSPEERLTIHQPWVARVWGTPPITRSW